MSLLSQEELEQLEEQEEQEKYESMKDENEPPNKKVKKNEFIPYLNNDFVKKIHEYIYVDSIVNIKEYLLKIDISNKEIQNDISWVLIKEKNKHHYSKKLINETIEFLISIGFDKKNKEIIEKREVFSVDILRELFIIKNFDNICKYISNVNYWENHLKIINILIRENPNLTDEFIRKIMKFLIDININFNLKSRDGLTPLKICIYHKNIEMCKILISIKAGVNEKNLIYDIIKSKDINIFKLFFDNDDVLSILDLNYQDREGITPIMFSIFLNQYEMTKILLEKGANHNLKNINGETPLMIACNNRNITFPDNNGNILKQEIINILIEKGSDINEKDNNSRTALYYSLANVNEFSIFTIISLLEAGANPNILDLNSNNALLSLIIENENIENSYGLSIMMTLINYGVNKTHLNINNENIYDFLSNDFLQYFQMFDSLRSADNSTGSSTKIFISKSCLICFEEDKKMILADSCRHIVCCYDCFIKLHIHQRNNIIKCPYCNIPITTHKIVENIS